MLIRVNEQRLDEISCLRNDISVIAIENVRLLRDSAEITRNNRLMSKNFL